MAPFHFPATLADLMDLWRAARPTAAIGPFPAGYGGLNPPLPQFVPEVSTVIALVGTQAGGSLLGTALWSGHPHPVHHLQPHSDLRYIGCRHQKGQRQAIALGQQMDRAPFALPAIGDVLSPF
jgi:hypothetical protein